MKKTLAFLAAFGVGGACAALLLWLWQANREDRRQFQAAREAAVPSLPAAPAPVTAALPVGNPAVEALLAQLQTLLTRADTRAKEGVLTFKDADAYRAFLARAKAAGLTVLGELPDLLSVRVRYDAFAALRSEIATNAADYDAVAANYLVSVPSAPALPPKEDRAALTQIPFGNSTLAFLGVPADHATWGKGVTIAVLDTGVLPDATLAGGRLSTLDIGLGTVPGRGEDDGHGTAVAALAAGAAPDAPGVAPSANILSIRVTDTSGVSDTFTVAAAILAATNAGAKVINVSLGGYATNSALDNAIGYATQRGAIVVAAAGNDQAAQLAWPAADSRVISVGAVDRAGQQVSFSNSGAQLCLTAPGYGVQTAWLDGQRVSVDGTSASAPLVSGAIAAALSKNPSLTPHAAGQLLRQTANDAGAPGPDADYGSGVLNVDWAMNRQAVGRYDPAIASHYYDAANNRMQFVVQNRSSGAVSGLALSLATTGGPATNTLFPLPPLAAGESYVASVPVDNAALRAAGTITYVTQLNHPPGVTDSVPVNNRKSSTLTAPTTK